VTLHDFDDGNGPTAAHRHPNGGGWVADTAAVSPSAVVGERAAVFGHARLLDEGAVVDTAWLCGRAVVADRARVGGDAVVEGDARILGSALVTDDAYVAGDAVLDGDDRAVGHARVTGSGTGGSTDSRMRRGRRVGAVVAILVTGAVGATVGYLAGTSGGPSTTEPTLPTAPTSAPAPAPAPAPATGFGGYSWYGTVSVIRGEWQVPTIQSTSPPGWASTWIAVQGPGAQGAFVQLGTTENCRPLPERFDPASPAIQSPCRPFYEAFWSDAQQGFHPVSLGVVRPGSTISAEIARTQSGWKLVMSGGQSAELVVQFGASSSVNRGQWIQEDPVANNQATADLPYPVTSTVTFDHLEINGRIPKLSFAHAQALSSVSLVDLVPTPVHDDSFSLVPATGAAGLYLADVTMFDDEANAYYLAMGRWNDDSVRTRMVEMRQFDGALGGFDSALESQAWPATARSAIGTLVGTNSRAQAYLAGQTNPTEARRDHAPVIPKADLGTAAGRRVRAALGLPPL
jgi:hypothetical protein